jgi:hypothetical protein
MAVVAGRVPAVVAGLLGLLTLEVAKEVAPARGLAVLVVGVLVGFAGGLLYVRGPAVRLWLRFASPAPIVFLTKVPWPVDGVSAMAAERSRRVKYFFNKPGQRLEVDGPQNQALALRGVTDWVARPEDGTAGLFEVGPFADLVGRRPEAVGLAGNSGLAARLNDPEKLQDVDPDSGAVPALISGALTGPAPGAPLSLAVAVNGTIGAVGLTFTQEDTPQTFATMVPDSLFQPGTNRVRLYQVEQTRAGPRLTRSPWRPDTSGCRRSACWATYPATLAMDAPAAAVSGWGGLPRWWSRGRGWSPLGPGRLGRRSGQSRVGSSG